MITHGHDEVQPHFYYYFKCKHCAVLIIVALTIQKITVVAMVLFPFANCIATQKPFNLEEIVQRKIDGEFGDDPFYVCDVSEVLTKYKIWTKHYPRIKPFYGKIIVKI